MVAAGVDYRGHIETDGKLRRVHVEGDKKGVRNGWYVLHVDARPFGMFGCNKRMGDQKLTWSAKGVTPLTAEQRRELAAKAAAHKAAKEAAERERNESARLAATAMWTAAAETVDHPYLARKGVPGYGVRAGDWVRESAPDAKTGEIHTTRTKNTLLIPLRDERKVIHSLQGVFAKPIKVRGEERDKDFVYGGRKRGLWFSIGKPTEVDDVLTIAIVEGYATGASVHRATGLAVVVAFDAGNLLPVAETVRRLMPAARIVFAADNDQWTTRQDGSSWNVGIERANEAAKVVGGLVVAPAFALLVGESPEAFKERKPTDFNDLDATAGLDEVRRQIMAVVSPRPAETQPEPEPPPHEAVPDGPEPADELPPTMDFDDPADERDDDFFAVLGHDRDVIYVYVRESKMIYARGIADWSSNSLTALAPLHWWETEFPGSGKTTFSNVMAVNWIQRTAYKRGFFEAGKCRGRGAWVDDGRMVFHLGDRMLVDGCETPLAGFDTKFVYEQGSVLRLPVDEPMSKADGVKLIEIAKKFRWTRPASAVLLAGWVALAPLCGALRWRPHIWVTGGAGSGKSTILEDFVAALLADGYCHHFQGNSTEAGIRQTLRSDAISVIFDESEQNTEREQQRIQAILALVRQASTESGARTVKGSQNGDPMGFLVRSMFCLASIQVGMKQQADMERITVLALRSKKDGVGEGGASEDWKALSEMLSAIKADPDLPSRLMRRSLALLPTTLKNIEVFAEAAAVKFGSQREGDQFGAMLAGAWSLVSTKAATLEDARAMIDRYNWSDYTEDTETEESSKALSALLGAKVRVKNGLEVTVYELVAHAANKPEASYDVGRWEDSDAVLRRYGMQIRWTGSIHDPNNASLLIANTSIELQRLVEHTPYAADLKGQLLRVPGAFRQDSVRFNGVKMRSVGIPMSVVLEGVGGPAVPLDLDDDLPF